MDVITKPDWASEKVRVFSKQTKEKSTLVAIAAYAKPDGSGAYPSISTLAKDTGHSERTVQRHIRALAARGELIINEQGGRRRGSHTYFIPCCQLTVEQLEAVSGVSRNQLKLPLMIPEQRGELLITALSMIVGVRNPRESFLSLSRCHDDTVGVSDCHPNNPLNNNLNRVEGFSLITKKEKRMKRLEQEERERAERERASEPISADTQALMADVMKKLEADTNTPVGIGTRMRNKLWGSQEERDKAYRELG